MSEEDINFWQHIYAKVAKELQGGLDDVRFQSNERNYEAPNPRQTNGHLPSQVCVICGESYTAFPILLHHMLTDHAKFGHQLLDDLKNGQNVRHIR